MMRYSEIPGELANDNTHLFEYMDNNGYNLLQNSPVNDGVLLNGSSNNRSGNVGDDSDGDGDDGGDGGTIKYHSSNHLVHQSPDNTTTILSICRRHRSQDQYQNSHSHLHSKQQHQYQHQHQYPHSHQYHHHYHYATLQNHQQQQQQQTQQKQKKHSYCKRHGSLYTTRTYDHHNHYNDINNCDNDNNNDDNHHIILHNNDNDNDNDNITDDDIDGCNKSLSQKTFDCLNVSPSIRVTSVSPMKASSPPKLISSSSSSSQYNADDNNVSLSQRTKQFSNSFYSGLRHTPRYSTISSSNSIDGTANGAATIAYVRHRKNSTKSCNFDLDLNTEAFVVESQTPENDKQQNQQHQQHQQHQHYSSKTLNMKSGKRKNSIGCLNAFYTSPESPKYFYGLSSSKSHSLPGHSSNSTKDKDNKDAPSSRSLECNILNALRVPADELANQLTLLDYNIFSHIQPDELTSCSWTKKDKHTVTPNIVAFTKRFNHTSFWTVQDILNGEQPKQRAEILSHFIKVAKKLHELNNLHSLFAIISALQSASIYRLKKTWSCLSKKDKNAFDRLSDIFSDQNNWENLRSYLESLRLPCIPYLGLFLTDLIYIDLAYPHKGGGLEPEQRRNRMNNILRVISNYQQSDYMFIKVNDHIQTYLNSIRYIEELQNIFEEEQYKKSLRLEPIISSSSSSTAMMPSSSSCSSKESCNHIDMMMVAPALACLNLSPAKTLGFVRIKSAHNATGTKVTPGHRKCRSLGTNYRSKSLPRNFSHKHCPCRSMMVMKKSGIFFNITTPTTITTICTTTTTTTNTTTIIATNATNATIASAITSSNTINIITPNRCHMHCGIFERTTNDNIINNSGKEKHKDQEYRHQQSQKQQQHKQYEESEQQQQQHTQRHLLDDSVLEIDHNLEQETNPHHPLTYNDSIHQHNLNDYHNGGDHDNIILSSSISSVCHTTLESKNTCINISLLNNEMKSLQGCVRRKTVQKEFRKPAVSSWQRYWLEIWSNSLVYFPPKSFKGSERKDFKREPCKVCQLDGWCAQLIDSTKHKNCFELYHRTLGTIYKFRTDSPQATQLWISTISKVANQHKTKAIVNQPINLMSFE